jgi:hypothetical protein
MGQTSERLHERDFAAWIERQLARQLTAKLRGMVQDAYPLANDRVRDARWLSTGLAEAQARLFQHGRDDDDDAEI